MLQDVCTGCSHDMRDVLFCISKLFIYDKFSFAVYLPSFVQDDLQGKMFR